MLTLWGIYQLALGALLLAFLFGAWKAAEYVNFLAIQKLQNHAPTSTAFIETEKSRLRDSLAIAESENRKILPDTTLHWTWIPLDSIPKPLKELALVAEDAKFYRHQGFDLEQMEYAIVANHQAGKAARSASTITQQVAKNLFLSGDKELTRKLREAAITLLLEQELGKDRILELYLNIAQFGNGVFGVREGAKTHFGKDVTELSPDQMVGLISLLPAPTKWNPKRSPSAYLAHKRTVMRNYLLWKGIRSISDTTAPEWLVNGYDSLDSMLSKDRWSKLRSSSMVPFDDSTRTDSAGQNGEEGDPPSANPNSMKTF